MKRKQALADLIAKVDAGGSDQDVLEASYGVAEMTGSIGRYVYIIGAYDGSLDAAKLLHEAVLPDWYVFIKGQKGYVWFAELMDRDDNRHPQTEGETPARAWLLSILRALHSMEPET